jgi:hypothetical protein
MTIFKTKTMHNLSRKDFLSAADANGIGHFSTRLIVLVPLKKKHDSGYPCIAVVACRWDDAKRDSVDLLVLGRVSDVIDLGPSIHSYRIDYLRKSGCACISNGDKIVVCLPLGSDALIEGRK